MVNKKSKSKSKLKSRLILIGITLLFFIPIIFSWYLVFFTDFKKNSKGTENGKLIKPLISIGKMQVKDISNKNKFSFTDKWTLIFFAKDECDKSCEDKLYKLRQIRLALGEDRNKVDRLVFANNNISWGNYTDSFYGQKYVNIMDYNFHNKEGFNLRSIYLMDPYGFFMMEYPEKTNPIGIIKDIERLINNSK